MVFATPLNSHTLYTLTLYGPLLEYDASPKVKVIYVAQYDYSVFVVCVWNSHTDEDYC